MFTSKDENQNIPNYTEVEDEDVTYGKIENEAPEGKIISEVENEASEVKAISQIELEGLLLPEDQFMPGEV